MLSRIAWAVAIVAASAFNTTVSAGTWVLETHWKCTEGKQDPSLEYYDTKAKVLERLEQHRKDHAQGGLLFYDPCKPVRFRYWFETDVNGTVSRTGMETVEVSPRVATIPNPKAGKGPAGSKGNRKWVMWLEQFNEGQWAPVPDRRFEYLESEGVTEAAWQEKLKRYENAVESENKKTIDRETQQQQKGRAVKPVRYRVRWSVQGTETEKVATQEFKIEGTEWLIGGSRHKFNANGGFQAGQSGQWSQSGNTVTIDKRTPSVPSKVLTGFSYTLILNGKTLSGVSKYTYETNAGVFTKTEEVSCPLVSE